VAGALGAKDEPFPGVEVLGEGDGLVLEVVVMPGDPGDAFGVDGDLQGEVEVAFGDG